MDRSAFDQEQPEEAVSIRASAKAIDFSLLGKEEREAVLEALRDEGLLDDEV